MTSRRYKILIVDDERTNIYILADMLKTDYEILIAKNGEQALKRAFSDITPDLILLDIVMPNMDGYEVCRRLKAEPKTQNIPIIFISAMSADMDEANGLELGAVDYITKPLSQPIVLARINTHLKLKRTHDDLEEKNAALEEAMVLREDVDQIIRHDLKAPLNGIIGLSSLLIDKNFERNKQREMLRIIEEAGYKMLEMINNSLDIYKMETGNYQYHPDKIDILLVVKKIVAESKAHIKAKGLAVEIMLGGKTVAEGDRFIVYGEHLLCYSMLANLFRNALEASPKVTSITVYLDKADTAIISIHNQGAVPIEIRDNFFDKYTTANKLGGTGLGTYSAKLMAETQGGSIQFESSEDTGTTVKLRLQLPNT